MSSITLIALATVLIPVLPTTARATGDAQKGAELFHACATCHSMQPDRHMTGPSLARA